MARQNTCGFETGDASELSALVGTASIQSTVKRTGSYALRSNPTTTGTGYGAVPPALNANGTQKGGTTGVSNLYLRFYLRIDTLPAASDEEIAWIATEATTATFIQFRVTSAGLVKMYKNHASPTVVATGTTVLSTGIFYRLEIHLGANSATAPYELKIDGVSEFSGTIDESTASIWGEIRLGKSINRNGQSVDFYYDDVAIDDSAYPGAGQVNILKPNATGTTSAWTNGAGTSPTNVAEVPHDSDTGYITSSTNGNVTTVNLDSSATGGVSGTIAATKVVGIVRDEGGASSMSIRAKSSATNSDTTAVDPGATYVALAKLLATDPNTSAAWTTSGLDALEIGVVNAASVAVRCTALYAMVECSGAVAATGYTNLPLMGVG